MLVHFYFEIWIKVYVCETDRSLHWKHHFIVKIFIITKFCCTYISNTSTVVFKDIIETIIVEHIQFMSV